jgi:hypothetical protein
LVTKETTAARTGAGERLNLDADTAAIVSWLTSVCKRSERGYDQQFIFRGPSIITRLLLQRTRGEVKAIAMPDLAQVSLPQFQMLKQHRLITLGRSRWPGVWFTLNRESLFGSGPMAAVSTVE